jgi:hypothetical protein
VLEGSFMDQRKAEGQFYTPDPVVRFIVRETLDRLRPEGLGIGDLRILEPACGEGVFLLESLRHLCSSGWAEGASFSPRWILQRVLYGVDRDRAAVQRARLALAAWVEPDLHQRAQLESRLTGKIRCDDALIGGDARRGFAPTDWQRIFPEVFGGGRSGFDAVIGNPPYVNIRRLSRHRGDQVKRLLTQHFQCASGAYDLYVLFFELALRLLRPGGLCGMIVPNKLATLNYAEKCRSMLARETTLLTIADLSGCRVFPDASVYPYIVIWKKQPPPPDHCIRIIQTDRIDHLDGGSPVRYVAQHQLQAFGGWHLHGVLDVEGRVATRPLDQVSEIHSGTTGFQAARVAAMLRERSADIEQTGFDFVVTGNVDRYRVRTGEVRFMHRRFECPYLPDDPSELTPRKRRLYRQSKILVAGMSRRLEAAWDPGGLALGVSLYAVVPQMDPNYLLALLNSKLMSYLFRLRFQAKRLQGGYLAINKGQLGCLPICIADDAHAARLRKQLAQSARELIHQGSAASDENPDPAGQRLGEAIDRKIDQLVYRLYGLTCEEKEVVESQTIGIAGRCPKI